MKKKISLLLLIITLAITTVKSQTYNYKIDTLNTEQLNDYKLRAEIKKIENDLNNVDKTQLLQTGTFCTAILALIISIVTSNRTNRRQIESLNSNNEHNAKLRVSNLLKELGSDSINVKIAAIQALSEYNSSFPFIVNSLKIEENQLVIDTVIKVLSNQPETSIKYLLEETRSIQYKKLEIGGKLVALGADRKTISEDLSINNKSLHNWIENKYGSRIKELTDIRIKNKIITSNMTDAQIRLEENISLYKDWEKIIISQYNVIATIESIVREASDRNIKIKMENAYLDGLMLVNVNLSDFSFKGSTLNYANFEGSNCTKTNFSNVQAKSFNLKNCIVQDSKFDHAILKYCDFRNSKGKNVSMKNVELLTPNFDGVNFKYSNFEESKLISLSFKNTLFVKANFNNAVIHNCDISATDLTESQFQNTRIFSSKFSTTRIRKSIFQNSKLSKIEMIKTSFDYSDMSFSSLIKIKSIDCQFSNANFVGAELVEVIFDNQTKLDGVIYENTKLVRCSENLQINNT
jgi:uncharacterized protein YjbI with pentapeptide repeats